MSQGNYSIELYFDAQLENQVLKAWNVLARRKISTQLIDMESRPHITLCSCSSLPWDPARLEPLLTNFASKQEPLSLFLSCIGGTPNEENVMFLAPTPSVSLLQFQSQLCDLVRKEGIEVGDEFRPEKWVPYVSVAQEVPRSKLGEAFCVLKDLKLPVVGYGIEIGLVEHQPVRELFSFELGNLVER